MPVEHAVLDFHPLEEVSGSHGDRMLRGLLVAASREMVLNAVHAVQKAGLTPTTVDLSSFAVLRSLGGTDQVGIHRDVEALVDIGAKVTNIVVHEAGVPRFIRILLMGGQDLTEAVAERAGVPVQQAEALKQQMGLQADANSGDQTPAVRALETAVSALLDEIRGSLDYYMASAGHPRSASWSSREASGSPASGPPRSGHPTSRSWPATRWLSSRWAGPDCRPSRSLRRTARRRAGGPRPRSRMMSTATATA